MKKTILTALGAVAALAFTACGDNCKTDNATAPVAKDNDKVELYAGVLPAADAQANVYTLKLDFDDDNNYTDGDYVMVQNTLASDTLVASGLQVQAWAFVEGDFTKESKVVDGNTIEYLKLVPDVKDSAGADNYGNFYFIIEPDGNLTMVNANLQKSENPALNYTLIRQ